MDLNQSINYLLMEEKNRNQDFKKSNVIHSFIHYSQTIDDVYENLEDCNPAKKRRVLIVFDDMRADMECNKKLYDSRYRI